MASIDGVPGRSLTAVRWFSVSARLVAISAILEGEVGRSAVELDLFDDEISFSDWKQSDPKGYDRACLHAFERASR